ncbi:MAG: hypothetical protein MJE68_02290 [Proteobacteria bacterium]|nr:hypothetical protein [Pseudomonadota bacterium]
MKNETLNAFLAFVAIVLAFLAFVFAVGAGVVIYANASDIVKKDDLARVEEQMVRKDDLAEVEERFDGRFDNLEDDLDYIKQRVDDGEATPVKGDGGVKPTKGDGESL